MRNGQYLRFDMLKHIYIPKIVPILFYITGFIYFTQSTGKSRRSVMLAGPEDGDGIPMNLDLTRTNRLNERYPDLSLLTIIS